MKLKNTLKVLILTIFSSFCVKLNAQVILSDPGTTYNNTDAVTFDSYGPVGVGGCTMISFSLDYNFSAAWEGSGNMETPDECPGAPCAGDPDNAGVNPGDPCYNCWDFLRVRYYVDGVVVFEDLIGDVGTTDAEQSGTISFDYCLVGTGAANASIDVSTQTWAASESVTFSNITITCMNTTPTLSPIGPFCENDAAVALSTIQDGVMGSWSGTGVTANTFDPSGGSSSLTFTPDVSECANTPPPINVVVNTATNVTLGPFPDLCSSDLAFTLTTTPGGITGTWGGTGVSGNTFDPAISGAGTFPITFTPAASECVNVTSPVNIIVNSVVMPNISGLDPNVCSDDPNVILGTVYSGITGSWTGATVINNEFVPSMATAGINTIFFEPDPGQCAQSAPFIFDVTPTVNLTINDPGSPFCNTDGIVNLTTNPGGISGIWSGTGTSGNTFDPSIANTGGNLITFTPSTGQCATDDNIVLIVDPAPTAANAGPLSDCPDQAGQGSFDLTSLEGTINGDPSVTFNWSEDMGGTTPIGDPSNYMSSGGTVYATVTLGSCSSTPVEVQLNLDATPNINSILPLDACEDEFGNATFDLTANSIVNGLNGGSGFPVSFFTDAAGNNPIADPSNFLITTSPVTVFAFVEDPVTMCLSAAESVVLNILPDPQIVQASTQELCDQGGGTATFDLNALNNTVDPTGGNTVTWYSDPSGMNPIANPGSYNTGNTTVYVSVSDGTCTSAILALDLNVTDTPTINPTDPNPVCDNGFGQGTFNLSVLENIINGGSGEPVNWYEDMGLTSPIADPSNYTGSGIIYVTVGTGLCLSGPEEINLALLSGPTGMDINETLCGDTNGQVTINLTDYDSQVNGTPGNTITWYSDPAGNNPIANPTMFTTGSTVVYAEVSDGNCTSIDLATFTITVNAAPIANTPVDPLTACIIFPFDATVNLTSVEGQINGNNGFPVNWYVDQAATIPITNPADFNFSIPTSVWATVTDPVTGCETPTTVEVMLALAFAPTANNPGTQTACDNGTGSASFNLSNLDLAIGGGNTVTYYSDPGLTNEIFNPSDYISSGGTVYAVVNDGVCDSAEEAFNLQVLPAPIANPVNGPNNFCADAANSATVNLTLYNAIVLGGQAGTVNWFSDPGGFNQIFPADAFLINGFTTVYAQVNDGTCTSALVPVDLNLLSAPDAFSEQLNECPDATGFATFDLTDFFFQNQVNGGTGNPITFYLDPGATNEIINPDAFIIDVNTIIFAVVTDANGCTSNIVPIDLMLDNVMMPNSTVLELCDEGNDQATFNLDDPLLQSIINGNSGLPINWYLDAIGNTPINNTSAFVSGTTQVFVTIQGASCESVAIPIDLNVLEEPEIFLPNGDLELCDEGNNQATFNLNTLNTTINGGNGYAVNWFFDANATNPIADPSNFLSGNATVYANTVDGICTSENTVPVNLVVLDIPSANGTMIELCDEGANRATFDLTDPDVVMDITGGASGVTLSWYEDEALTMPIADPSSFFSPPATVYVVVSNGSCDSDPTEVELIVIGAPVVLPIGPLVACDEGNGTAFIDLTQFDDNVNAGQGFMVNWYTDSNGNNPVANPTNHPVMDGSAVYAAVFNSTTGCESPTVTISIDVPSPIDGMIALVQPISCASFNDGSIDLMVSGGTEPYSYDWNDDTFDGQEDLSDLSAGTYQVTITDDEGCVGTALIILTEPDELIINCSEFAPVSTVGGSDGIAEIDIMGGTAPYQLTYNGPSTGSVNANTDGTTQISGLQAGNYTLTIVDGNNCMTDCSFTINDPSCDLSLEIVGTNIDCNGAMNGSIDLTITGGSGNYTIDWSDDNFDGVEDPSSLAEGSYSVTVTDDQSCESTASITITEPSAVSLACSESSPVSTIGGADGVAELIISGGTSPYTIDFDGPTVGSMMNISEGSTLLNDLMEGTYNITITDENGCQADCSVDITGPSCSLTLDISGMDISCFGANDGTVDLTINNGTAPFTIDWSDDTFDGQEDLTQVGPGMLDVTVTDAEGCMASTSITITEPSELTIICGEDTPVSAVGGMDGIAAIDITGGTAPFDITYTGPIDGSSTAMMNGITLINNLSAGDYTVMVTDANGCETTCMFTITDPSCNLTVSFSGTLISCFGANDGAIDLTITNGTEPFTIDWSDDAFDGQEDITGVGPGSISVTVTDAEGCTAGTSITLTEPDELIIDCSEETPVSTIGGMDGVASIDIMGGTASYNITYTGPESGAIMSMTAGVTLIPNLPAGSYDITVTDINGCDVMCTVNITDPSCSMTLDISGTDISCFGANDGTVDLTINNGTAPFTIDWNNDTFDGQEDLTQVGPGLLEVTVTDAAGCTASTSITIIEPTELTLACAEDTAVSTVGGMDGVASVTITGGTAPYDIAYAGPVNGMETSMMEGAILLSNLAAGSYTITITDANDCTSTCTVTITDPACSMTLDISGTDISCFGANDGTVDLTINNGTAPFTIDWSNDAFDGQEDLTQVGPGLLEVTVTDAGGCTASTLITITEPTELILACGEDTAVSTVGGMDGIASITIMGGTAPYDIAYAGPVNGMEMAMMEGVILLPNLLSGDYTITITDANGCITDCTLTITEPVCTMTLDISGTDVSCFGANDGTVDLTINNGTAPFTIDWSNDAFDGQEDLTQVGPGMLDVTVTDAVGCTASTSITITEPAELTLACAEDTAVSTVGGMDGAASITITGGTTPYDIAYAGPVNGMETTMMEGVTLLSNLAAGDYTITITDANDCTTDCTVTITEPVCTMTLDIVGTEISCFGANDGMVDLTINDGTAPFTIDWSNDVFDDQEDLTQVGPGLLTVIVTDAVGCTASTMITFIEPDELLLNCAESAAVTTMSGTDGVASIVITGGTSDYNVTYDGPSSGTLMANDEGELLISDLAAGVYNILVEDANGCQTDCTVEITEPICIMTIELDVVDISCNGENDGSINLSIFDGTGPFMIDWSDDTFDGMQFIQDLSPGAYSVTVTDAQGCMAFADTMIMEPAALTLNCAQESPATTVGGDDGAAAISFGGGTPPYTLTYNGGEFGIVNEDQAGDIIISDLMPGDYTLVLVDANDCAIECNFIIEEPECNMALSIDGTNITCFGANDGTIDVTVSNATAPFTFDWTDDTLDGIEDPTGLGAGTYTVKVTDVFGCSESITIEITEPEMIALTCNVEQNVSVEGGNDGLASIFVTGGTPPFTGSYTGPLAGTIDPLAVGTNVFLQDLIAGIYTLDVTDANGCQTNCTFEITEPVCLLTVDLNSTNLSCNGGNDGAINLVINNVTPPYTVDWNEDVYDGLENLSGLAAGFYQVRITDAFGCEVEASITLTEPDPIVVKTASVNPSCFGDNNGELILETITGGTAPYEVSIDGDFFQFVVDLPISFPNLPSGTYTMTIQDANDCLFEVEVEVEAKEELTLDLGTDIVLELGDSVRLEGIPNFVVDSLVWSPSAGLSQPDQLTTFVQPLENISYILTVFDEFGCSTSDQVNLVVQRPSDVFVPTAFSPNADGSNDRFTIFAGNSVEQILNFQIFDRWGNQLYQNGPIVPNDPTLGWDGNYNGQMMNTGVYVYFIEIQMVDGTIELLKGDVLLLRN